MQGTDFQVVKINYSPTKSSDLFLQSLPAQADPYESRMVRVGPSQIGQGEGLFAR
jgi:hypothetical protein